MSRIPGTSKAQKKKQRRCPFCGGRDYALVQLAGSISACPPCKAALVERHAREPRG